MNATRANTAAGRFARAVQNVASTASEPVKRVAADAPEAFSSEPETVTATVLHVSGKGAQPPYGPELHDVEIGGVVFTRAADQNAARQSLEQDRIFELIVSHGVDGMLLGSYEGMIHQRRDDEERTYMRRIGRILVDHEQKALWRLVYMAYIGEDRNYCLGDETLFLQSQPVSDDNDYAGPPTWEFTSAQERAWTGKRSTPTGQS